MRNYQEGRGKYCHGLPVIHQEYIRNDSKTWSTKHPGGIQIQFKTWKVSPPKENCVFHFMQLQQEIQRIDQLPAKISGKATSKSCYPRRYIEIEEADHIWREKR